MADDDYYASMGLGPTVVAPTTYGGDDEAPVVSAPIGNPWDAPPPTYAADPTAGYGM